MSAATPGANSDAAPVGGWRRATVREVAHPTPHGVRLRLAVPDRIDHLPGQYYVVRLTTTDGYRTQRFFSVASAPSDDLVELFVQRLDDGEVSTHLADVVVPGDELDVGGPVGDWFVWHGDSPALGVAGGTGVVPLVAMLRHAVHTGRSDLLRLAVSARTMAELPYADELVSFGALIALTREDTWNGRPRGRLCTAELVPLVPADGPSFVCGSAGFAEAAGMLLLTAGVPADRIRVERFGPTG